MCDHVIQICNHGRRALPVRPAQNVVLWLLNCTSLLYVPDLDVRLKQDAKELLVPRGRSKRGKAGEGSGKYPALSPSLPSPLHPQLSDNLFVHCTPHMCELGAEVRLKSARG